MALQPLATWEDARTILDEALPQAETAIQKMKFYGDQYPAQNSNPEGLAKLLSQLNVCVIELGELQPILERVKNWSERKYEIEKGLEAMRIIRSNKSAAYAKEAKYEKMDDKGYVSVIVDASAMHMRVQNARSSARDNTEAMRSRISQIKGSIRSS